MDRLVQAVSGYPDLGNYPCRATYRPGFDCMLHVNPFIKHRGMVVVFNPTDRDITKEMRLPLYYTGLQQKVTVLSASGERKTMTLDKDGNLSLPVSVKAQGTAWFLIEE